MEEGGTKLRLQISQRHTLLLFGCLIILTHHSQLSRAESPTPQNPDLAPVVDIMPLPAGEYSLIAGSNRQVFLSILGEGVYNLPTVEHVILMVAGGSSPTAFSKMPEQILAYDLDNQQVLWSQLRLTYNGEVYDDHVRYSRSSTAPFYAKSQVGGDYELRVGETNELVDSWSMHANDLPRLPDLLEVSHDGSILVGKIGLYPAVVQKLAVLTSDGVTTTVTKRTIVGGATGKAAISRDSQQAALVLQSLDESIPTTATLHILDLATLADLHIIEDVAISHSLAYSPDGLRLAILSAGVRVDIYETGTYDLIESKPLEAGANGSALAWLNDNATIVVGTSQGHIWELPATPSVP